MTNTESNQLEVPKKNNVARVELKKELGSLSESKAQDLRRFFEPMLDKVEEFENDFNEIVTMEHCPRRESLAKRLRLDISKIRVAADKYRKEQKAEYIRAGKAIQGAYAIVEYAVKSKEDKLKEIETTTEREEAERIAKIQREREDQLEKYEADGSQIDLGNMAQDVWSNYLAGVKRNYEEVKAAEAEAEKQRIEKERKEKLLSERRLTLAQYSHVMPGIQFKIDADTEEDQYKKALEEGKALADEKAKRDKEVEAENERLRKEKAEADAKAAEAAAKAEEERKAREAEDRKRREEEQAKADNEAKLAAAPDREKLIALREHMLSVLDTLQTEKARQSVERTARMIMFTISDME